jgi:hypothetical protein
MGAEARQDLSELKVARAKFGLIDDNLKAEQQASCDAGRDAVGLAYVTRFEGLAVHKWNQPELASRLQGLVEKLTVDCKSINFAGPELKVHPGLWKAVQSAIST